MATAMAMAMAMAMTMAMVDIPELSGWIVHSCGPWGRQSRRYHAEISRSPQGNVHNHHGKPRRSLVPADDHRVQPIGGHLEDSYPLGTEGTIDRSVLEKRHAIAVGDIDHNIEIIHRFDHISDRASGRFAPTSRSGAPGAGTGKHKTVDELTAGGRVADAAR